jgi:pimeloyl-ACP methyl ester carboxylesterase
MNILLLPGLDGTGRLFEPLVRYAPEWASCTVARYPADRELSYPECADLVSAEFLPDAPFVIVAESFSGPVAILTASKRPPNLKGLVLFNTFAYRASWREIATFAPRFGI